MTAHGRSNLIRFDLASRRADSLTTGDHDIVAYTATPDAQRFALTISDGTHVGDLYTLDAASRTLTQLTHVNDSLWSGLHLSSPERISYRSFDGTMIDAWIYKPPDFNPGTKYPLILNIHGGPHAAYGDTSSTKPRSWRRAATSSSTPTRAAAPHMASILATSSSTTIR